MKAWVLTLSRKDGKSVIEGVALTNEAASVWVSENDEFGQARTSIPYDVIDAPAERQPRWRQGKGTIR